MTKYQISVAKEDAEKVDTVRFAWQKLNASAVSQLASPSVWRGYKLPNPSVWW